MHAIQNMNDLLTALSMLIANDSKTIKKGEKLLKAFLKVPANASYLILVLRNQQQNSDVAIRHHAALLLKKKLGTFYSKYALQQQQELKGELLTLLVQEPEAAVATAIAGIIAVVAKAIFEKGGSWEELFAMLMTLTSDPNEKHRALSFKLLAELAEHVSEQLKGHVATIAQMFVAGCQDADNRVSSAAISALNAYIDTLGDCPEVMAFTPVIPHMLQVLENRLKSGDEDLVVEGLDVLQECVSLEQPLLNDFIEPITNFVVSLVRHKEIESSIKQSAGQTLMDIMQYRPKLFAKKGLVSSTLLVLMEIIAQDHSSGAGSLFALPMPHNNTDGDDEDDEDDEASLDSALGVQRLAQSIIDTMAIYIPSKYFVETALGLCSQGLTSPEPHMRKAGCAVLGVIAEGCSDTIRTSLAAILPHLIHAVRDTEGIVRECACFALGQFSEHCQPDILHYNHLVLPAMFDALDDPLITVQCTSCYVLEYFCEALQAASLRPFLEPLVGKLLQRLQSDKQQVKEMALSALAATAVAAEADFIPFTHTVCTILQPMLFLTEPKHFALRGRAIECWGHIAVGVGRDHFAPYFHAGMLSAVQGSQLNDTSLVEHAFVYVANASKCMKDAFVLPAGQSGDLMADTVPFVIQTIEESELIQIVDEDDDGEEEAAGHQGEEEDDESDEGDIRLQVEEGFINTKKAALTALGALAEHTGALFYPYLTQTLSVLVNKEVHILTSVHEAIRAEGVSILQYYVQAILQAKQLTALFATDKKNTVRELDTETALMVNQILSTTLSILLEDDSKIVVAQACESLSGILDHLGATACQQTVTIEILNEQTGEEVPTANTVLAFLLQALKQLLTQQAICQKVVHSEEQAGEEGEEDHDHVLIDSVSDLLSKLAQSLPAQVFHPIFQEYYNYILPFAKENRPPSDRSMAIGCLAEVFRELGDNTLQYLSTALPIIQANLADPLESVRRNTAFCLHVVIEVCGAKLADHHLAFLQWLHPLCLRSAGGADAAGAGLQHDNLATVDSLGADVDNAISAVCKMMLINPSLPYASILPVLLNSLPLRGDASEGPNVYRTIVGLVTSGHAVCLEKINLQASNTFLTLNGGVNMAALQPLLSGQEAMILLAIYAVLVQAISNSSNAIDETKAIVSSGLKEIYTKASNPVYRQTLEGYLQSINDADLKQRVIALLHA
eukprot:gene8516-9389_t